MYIVVQLRSIALIFGIFLSFLVINKDLFVPEKSGNVADIHKGSLISFELAFKKSAGAALSAQNLVVH